MWRGSDLIGRAWEKEQVVEAENTAQAERGVVVQAHGIDRLSVLDVIRVSRGDDAADDPLDDRPHHTAYE